MENGGSTSSSSGSSSSSLQASMQEFKLFETQSNGNGVYRVLKIDRLDASELNLNLRFIKFLGPYYMLVITERREIGEICGHRVHEVSKSEIFLCLIVEESFCPVEREYKKLLCMVDLTKDFFFSYSFNIMRSFQKNICNHESGATLCKKMFVWNEFLTWGIRHLRNTVWTVALVYGFFKQNFYMIGWNGNGVYRVLKIDRLDASELNVSEDSTAYTKKECYELLKRIHEGNKATGGLKLVTLCYGIIGFIKFLGPYYMLVITERREIGEICGHRVYEVSKSEIISLRNSSVLSNFTNSRDENRYKRLLCMVDLTKDFFFSYSFNIMRSFQKNICDRESGGTLYKKMFVWNEFLTRGIRHHLRNTVWTVALVYGFFKQTSLSEAGRNFKLTLIARRSRHNAGTSKTANVLALLGKVATCALMLTGFFYYQVTPAMKLDGYLSLSSSDADMSPRNSSDDDSGEYDSPEKNFRSSKNVDDGDYDVKPSRLQSGVLRTNCIDCLDRTNVAQYAYGWAALGQQLHALGIRDAPTIELDDPLSSSLMGLYERMGDTLAYQYGGSAAHNKVFSERRGQWKAATQSQEFLRTLQRYYNNAYMDADKQDAINIFLGTFRPEQGKLAVWELRSDSQSNERNEELSMEEDERFFVKRCLSDGNILHESRTPMSAMSSKHESISRKGLSSRQVTHIVSESSPDMPAADVALSRCAPSMPSSHFFGDAQKVQRNGSNSNYLSEQEDMSSVSNFVDVEWLSSSENLCENDQLYRPSALASCSTAEMSSSEIIISEIKQSTPAMSESGSSSRKGKEPMGTEPSVHTNIRDDFTDSFKQWVAYGEALCH
ncbi:hypothetical protein F2Q69_00044409 [Brassica cretica]|uniref:SAC domain-containing protein n=1 Tax=Brassica cretica TaxID=69181 RepID=A0A8S9N686_BRACR|nr:hypothetical protein F2Q69_00044409 [Brassica cretica]